MQVYDIIMLIVLAFATLRGYSKGLVWQIASISSIVVSYFIAYNFRDRVAVHIALEDPWRSLVAMLLLYVASSLLIWFFFQNIRGAIEKAKLKDFDRQLGAIFGAVKGVALCVVITLFAVSLLQPSMTTEIVKSNSGGYIARVLDETESFIPEELHEILGPYLRRAEERLQNRENVGPTGVAVENGANQVPPFQQTQEPSGAITDQIRQHLPAIAEQLEDGWFREANEQNDPLSDSSRLSEPNNWR